MNNYVRVVDGVVVETVQSDIAISELFHPAAGFVAASADVRGGWLSVDGKFYAPKVDGAYTFKQAKTAKIDEINSRAQAFVDAAINSASTPAFEVATWSLQGAEAEAWYADKSTSTPTLDSIAARRGVPVDILRQKAYEKSIAYKALTSAIAGQRQRYEDLLAAAKTVEDIENIVVTYDI